MSLEALAAFAVANNHSPSRVPMYDLAVEDARKLVKIKDGNKVAKNDGSQALTLTLGRHTLPLDAIAKGATRVNAAADQVEQFSKVLRAAIDEGKFDAEIRVAQDKSRPKLQAAPVAEETPTTEGTGTGTLSRNMPAEQEAPAQESGEVIEGLDFGGIED